MLTAADLQRQTLRLYGELLAHHVNWGGKLVFTSGKSMSATGLPAAVSIAGGTTLVLDPDAATVKAVFRTGGIDFVVNTLDEALRVLKNEIRQHRPLSVALIADLESALAEMSERGVQPDLRMEIAAEPSAALQHWLDARGWAEVEIPAASPAALRALDARLLKAIPPEDTVRRAWLQRIAHYQRPAANSSRVLWLATAELEAVSSSPNL